MTRTDFDLSIYAVLDPYMCRERGQVATAEAAVRGGATMVQLRDKDSPNAQRIQSARDLVTALAPTKARVIVNDDVAAAIQSGAHGLHIGQGDGDPAAIRAEIGPDMILGLSVETVEHVRAVDPEVVDYIGVGPVFATQTKADHAAPLGMAGLADIIAMSPVPVVAIGGIKKRHVADAMAAGADGIAVVSEICAAPDPFEAAFDLAMAQKLAKRKRAES